MAAKIIVSAKVYIEIEDIMDWYNDNSDVVATNFLEEANNLLQKLPAIQSYMPLQYINSGNVK